MDQIPTSDRAATAVLRFGLGARPGELDVVRSDPAGWLHAQVTSSGADQPLRNAPGSAERLGAVSEAAALTPEAVGKRAEAIGHSEAFARARLAIETPAGFRERWALFWMNHFSVTVTGADILAAVGAYEREAIRPYVFARFEDLALSALKHPVMLLYYDQAASSGPHSDAGGGANENLGRELLELHTVGRDAGYVQADVGEMSLALTGWSVGKWPERKAGQYLFRADRHEPGARTVLGGTFDAPADDQADRIVRYLAMRPETARRLAWKIASHFVADAPPPSVVDQLSRAYLESGGSLAAVAHALVAAPESWAAPAQKIKTPYEFYVSVHRARASLPASVHEPRDVCWRLDQPIYGAPSPRGWPDEARAWASAASLAKRADWLLGLVPGESSEPDLVRTAEAALGARLAPRTLAAIRGSSAQAPLPLLFLSPEFLRR